MIARKNIQKRAKHDYQLLPWQWRAGHIDRSAIGKCI